MDNSRTSRLGIVGLITADAALIAGLHSLGSTPGFAVEWSDPVRWLHTTGAEDTIAAVLRSIGLGMGYWILVSTVLYLIATLIGRERRPRWVKLMTLPAIRRTIDRALASTLAFSIAATPTASLRAEQEAPMPAPAVYEIADDGIPVPHVRMNEGEDSPIAEGTADAAHDNTEVQDGYTPGDVDPAATTRTPATQPVGVVTPPPPTGTTVVSNPADPAPTYTVERGDNLWTISVARLETITADPPIGAIDRYWRSVISANQGTLRSGDPNLIYPGEIIVLPAPEATP